MTQRRLENKFKIYTYEEIREDEHKFEEVYDYVRRFGSYTISHLSIQPKMEYFVVLDKGFIGFMRKGKKAYVLGDPFCDSKNFDSLLVPFFAEFKDVCFLQISYEFASHLSLKHGFYSNVFGTETIVEHDGEPVKVEERKELRSLEKELLKHEKEKDKLYKKMHIDKHKKNFWKTKSKVHKLRKKVSDLEDVVNDKENKYFVDKHLSQKDMRFLRREYNLGKKHGLSMFEATSFEEIDFDVLESISNEWLFEKVSKTEMSFLLRPLEKNHLLKNDRRLFLLSNGNDVVGFIEIVPMHAKGEIFGYYADIIRVRKDAPGGSVNFFLLEIMNQLFVEGYTAFSLGLSPFHRVEPVVHKKEKRIDNSFVTFMFRNTFHYGNFLYNSKGQAFHKEKFRAKMDRTYYATRKAFPIFEILGGFIISGIDIFGQIFSRKK